MLPDTGIDDVKKQRNTEYAKHINDPVLSSLKMEGIRLLLLYGRMSGLESVLAWCRRLISLTLPGVEPQSCSPHLLTSLTSLTRVFRSAFCMDFFYVCCIIAQLIHVD
jgi:hypothetical protein